MEIFIRHTQSRGEIAHYGVQQIRQEVVSQERAGSTWAEMSWAEI